MPSVDTSIHPHATGAAATYAAAHSEPQPITLYCGWFCPFAQRAWMVLHEKNIPHRYVETNPYKKEAWFMALNPRGLVPTLVLEDSSSGSASSSPRSLYESTVVCEFLDEAFPDERMHGQRLLPANPYERARCRIWIDHVSKKIVPAFYRFIQHTPGKPYTIEEARDEFWGQVETFVRAMDAKQGPWFLGGKFSLVDLMLAPWAKRLFLIDHYKQGGLGKPGAGPGSKDGEVWARWKIWHEAVTERQSVVATWSDDDRYIEVYKRYADDTTQSLVGQATRTGKHLP